MVYLLLWTIWVRQWEGLSHMKWEITFMFQTTNQILWTISYPWIPTNSCSFLPQLLHGRRYRRQRRLQQSHRQAPGAAKRRQRRGRRRRRRGYGWLVGSWTSETKVEGLKIIMCICMYTYIRINIHIKYTYVYACTIMHIDINTYIYIYKNIHSLFSPLGGSSHLV